jgi:hypothetical protein
MSWTTYGGLQVPSSSSGDAGTNLTSNFETLANRTSGTAGSVMFIGSGGYAYTDYDNLFFDDSNYFLGIGTNSPAYNLHVFASTPAIYLQDTSYRTLTLTGPTSANASIVVSNTDAGLDIKTNGADGIQFYTNDTLQVTIASDPTTTTLAVSGSLSTALSTQTSAYSVSNTDSVLLANATSAAFTLTLPTAVGCAGREYRFKKIDSSANAVTIATSASQTIDGASTYSLPTQYAHVLVISDGSNWAVL